MRCSGTGVSLPGGHSSLTSTKKTTQVCHSFSNSSLSRSLSLFFAQMVDLQCFAVVQGQVGGLKDSEEVTHLLWFPSLVLY